MQSENYDLEIGSKWSIYDLYVVFRWSFIRYKLGVNITNREDVFLYSVRDSKGQANKVAADRVMTYLGNGKWRI